MENTAGFVLSQTGKPMSVIITLQGHYDISPKYINAKKTYCTGWDSDLGKMSNRMRPTTSF